MTIYVANTCIPAWGYAHIPPLVNNVYSSYKFHSGNISIARSFLQKIIQVGNRLLIRMYQRNGRFIMNMLFGTHTIDWFYIFGCINIL